MTPCEKCGRPDYEDPPMAFAICIALIILAVAGTVIILMMDMLLDAITGIDFLREYAHPFFHRWLHR
jgi:hypothetical protein